MTPMTKLSTVDLDRQFDDGVHFITPVSMSADGRAVVFKLDVILSGMTLRSALNECVRMLRTDFGNGKRPLPNDSTVTREAKLVYIRSCENKIIKLTAVNKAAQLTPEEIVNVLDEAGLVNILALAQARMDALTSTKKK